MNLSKSEERVMQALWKLNKASMQELISTYDEPKPATTTMATFLKRLQEKEIVSYETQGRSRIYSPLVSKKSYFADRMNHMVHDFFNNSNAQFASYFTKETDLTREELKDLRKLIDEKLDKK